MNEKINKRDEEKKKVNALYWVIISVSTIVAGFISVLIGFITRLLSLNIAAIPSEYATMLPIVLTICSGLVTIFSFIVILYNQQRHDRNLMNISLCEYEEEFLRDIDTDFTRLVDEGGH